MTDTKILVGSCLDFLKDGKKLGKVHLTFLDPPFNQNKDYTFHNDSMTMDEYWRMMEEVCRGIYRITPEGGAIYFMQREKDTGEVLHCLRETGWTLQNLIIWKKKTSAVPVTGRLPKTEAALRARKEKKNRNACSTSPLWG